MSHVGSVMPNGEAIIEVRLRGPRGQLTTARVAIDTGFTGTLVIDRKDARDLQLESRENGSYTLADGSTVAAPRFAVDVEWMGAWLPVMAVCMDGGRLLGMRLLEGCRLEMEVVAGGAVEIAPLIDS